MPRMWAQSERVQDGLQLLRLRARSAAQAAKGRMEMSNQARKEKRQKERLKVAERAVERVKVLEGEQTTDRAALTRAMDDLVELQDKFNDLEADYMLRYSELLDINAKNRTLEQDNEQLMAANIKLRSDVRDFIEDTRNLQKELKEVKVADHDAAKLRRRLGEKSKTILELESQLSALKKEKVAGW